MRRHIFDKSERVAGSSRGQEFWNRAEDISSIGADRTEISAVHPCDARDLARQLMNKHGLSGWRFGFDHARRRFGRCNSSQQVITLSRPLTLLNPLEQVRDTILHEIAHALTPGDGHGGRWKAVCVRIGARPKRCYTDTTVVSPPRPPAPYRYGCRPCNWWVDRRRLHAHNFVCAKCKSALTYQEKSTGAFFPRPRE